MCSYGRIPVLKPQLHSLSPEHPRTLWWSKSFDRFHYVPNDSTEFYIAYREREACLSKTTNYLICSLEKDNIFIIRVTVAVT